MCMRCVLSTHVWLSGVDPGPRPHRSAAAGASLLACLPVLGTLFVVRLAPKLLQSAHT